MFVWHKTAENKSYRTHGTVEIKIESFSSRFSMFYDSMSSDCDLYHAPSFKKLKAEPFISVSLRLLLFAFGAWYKYLLWQFFKKKIINLMHASQDWFQLFECLFRLTSPGPLQTTLLSVGMTVVFGVG